MKSPLRSSLPKPTDETRVMRGKNAARAAPILALAPLSRFSAWRMSGRLQQHIGRQAGWQVLQSGERFGKRVGQKLGRHLGSDHQVQGVFILGHEVV